MLSCLRPRFCWFGSYTMQEGVPPIKSLRRMDAQTITDVLDTCASYNTDETLFSCCRMLDKPNKLTPKQKLAILRSMFTTVTHMEVARCSMVLVADTMDSLLKDSEEISELERMALLLEITLAKWIPRKVSSMIINLFNLPAIPEDAVFWAVQRLMFMHGTNIEPHLRFMLNIFIPIMKTATAISQKYWLCIALEILAGEFVPYMDASLGPRFFDGYIACKSYYLETTPDLYKFRGQVVATLGNLANSLTKEQLDEELPWVAEQIRSLQCCMPPDMAFDLIKPLEMYIKAATTKACREVKAALPAVLPALMHPICTPSSGASNKGQDALKVSKNLMLSFAHSHSSAVYEHFKKSLIQTDGDTRVGTLLMLRELLAGTSSEDPHYLEAVLQMLQDDNKKVIYAVLGLISDLTEKGCYDKNGTDVIEYLVKKISIPVKEQPSPHVLEDEVEEEAISKQSAVILNTIALRRGNADKEFWEGLLTCMLEKDFTGSVPTLCQILLSVDKEASINLKECVKNTSRQSLLVRLLVIASCPCWEVQKGTSVLAMLERLIPVIYPSLAGLFSRKMPPLMEYLKASSKNTFKSAEWKCKLVSLLEAIIEDPPHWEWTEDLMQEFAAQIANFFYYEHEEGFIFRCLGRCMALCDDRDLVLYYLRNMFGSTRFTCSPDHVDLVIAFQDCAKVHRFECRKVLVESLAALFLTEQDPDDFLDDITPSELRANFDIPNFVAEKRFQEMLQTMRKTLQFCTFLISK